MLFTLTLRDRTTVQRMSLWSKRVGKCAGGRGSLSFSHLLQRVGLDRLHLLVVAGLPLILLGGSGEQNCQSNRPGGIF